MPMPTYRDVIRFIRNAAFHNGSHVKRRRPMTLCPQSKYDENMGLWLGCHEWWGHEDAHYDKTYDTHW